MQGRVIAVGCHGPFREKAAGRQLHHIVKEAQPDQLSMGWHPPQACCHLHMLAGGHIRERLILDLGEALPAQSVVRGPTALALESSIGCLV